MTLRGIRWCGMGFPLFAFAGGTQNSFVHAQRSSLLKARWSNVRQWHVPNGLRKRRPRKGTRRHECAAC